MYHRLKWRAPISHNDVEAAVVGRKDDAGLVKPHACVVLVKGAVNNEEKSELKDYVKNKIAHSNTLDG